MPSPEVSLVTGLEANEKAPREMPSYHKGNYKINFIAVAVLVLPLVVAGLGICMGVPVQWKTVAVGIAFYLFNGLLGITAGYHRLFSHRAFKASYGLQWVLAFAGAGAFEGSAKWWCRNHRIHHRYVDTDKDPYNALRGFIFSHAGWMIMKQDYSLLGKVDVTDFKYNKVIQLQHQHFFKLAMLSGIILPTVICGLGWGDWTGGYLYAAMAKIVVVHHATFFINSLAHTNFFGAKQNYSDRHSSHDSWVCALMTFGEGYHNFHHEFAQDFRNGIKWYHYDPTKWFIRLCAALGFASHLVRTPAQVIERNNKSMLLKKAKQDMEFLEKRLQALEPPVCEHWTWDEIQQRIAQGRKLIVIDGNVIDVMRSLPNSSDDAASRKPSVWYTSHPGGAAILDMFVGKDATNAFRGGVYSHSLGAENMLFHLRVAQVKQSAV